MGGMRHSEHYMGVQVSLEKASWDIAESSGKLIKTQTAESQPKVLGDDPKMCVFNKFLTLHFENPGPPLSLSLDVNSSSNPRLISRKRTSLRELATPQSINQPLHICKLL